MQQNLLRINHLCCLINSQDFSGFKLAIDFFKMTIVTSFRLKKEDNDSDFSSPEKVYYYDAIGNRIGIDTNNDGDYLDTVDKAYTYTDTYNTMRLSEVTDGTGTTSEYYYTYDKNGNMRQKDNRNSTDNEYIS